MGTTTQTTNQLIYLRDKVVPALIEHPSAR